MMKLSIQSKDKSRKNIISMCIETYPKILHFCNICIDNK
mgnify:CR=1 FL=1